MLMHSQLIVELNEKSQVALAARVAQEGRNKSTIINSAIHLYAYISAAQDAGAEICVVYGNGKVEGVTII